MRTNTSFVDRRRVLRQSGITLIELLITISLCSGLMAMTGPALILARQKANELRCLNSVRNISLASALFSEENSDKIVPHALLGATGRRAILNNQFLTYWPDLLAQHLSSPENFRCPESRSTNETAVSLGMAVGSLVPYLSSTARQWTSVSAVAKPGQTFMFGDADWIEALTARSSNADDWNADTSHSSVSWTIRVPSDPAFDRIPTRAWNRHGHGLSAGFVDGHVEPTRASALGFDLPQGHAGNRWDLK